MLNLSQCLLIDAIAVIGRKLNVMTMLSPNLPVPDYNSWRPEKSSFSEK